MRTEHFCEIKIKCFSSQLNRDNGEWPAPSADPDQQDELRSRKNHSLTASSLSLRQKPKVREDLTYKKSISFGHCPNYLSQSQSWKFSLACSCPRYGTESSMPVWWPNDVFEWTALKNLSHRYDGQLGDSYSNCLRLAIVQGYEFYNKVSRSKSFSEWKFCCRILTHSPRRTGKTFPL